MTAKEMVLKVFPSSKPSTTYCNGEVWIVTDKTEVVGTGRNEEQAWENAADTIAALVWLSKGMNR